MAFNDALSACVVMGRRQTLCNTEVKWKMENKGNSDITRTSQTIIWSC